MTQDRRRVKRLLNWMEYVHAKETGYQTRSLNVQRPTKRRQHFLGTQRLTGAKKYAWEIAYEKVGNQGGAVAFGRISSEAFVEQLSENALALTHLPPSRSANSLACRLAARLPRRVSGSRNREVAVRRLLGVKALVKSLSLSRASSLLRVGGGYVCCACRHSSCVSSHVSLSMGPDTKRPSWVSTKRMPSRCETLREPWFSTALGTCISGRARVSNQ